MQTNRSLKTQLGTTNTLLTCASFFVSLLVSPTILARPFFDKVYQRNVCGKQDTAAEKKVDYLERIYFSGEDKEGLNTKILIALQELQNRLPTPALAKQVTFLIDIQDKASDAENACDILDMLAVGIYHIDAAEAEKQGVRMPSSKAKAKAGDALSSLNQLNRNSYNLSSSANNVAWSSYLLNGGKYSGFTAGASKVARTAGTVGVVTGAAVQVGQTGKDLIDFGKKMGVNLKKKDKPCNDVAKKDIEIGEHIPPGINTNVAKSSTGSTKVLIKNINYNQLSTISAAMDKIEGIRSVSSDDFNNHTATIQVNHDMKVKELIDKIIASNKSIDFNVENVSANSVTLVIK